MSEEINNNKVVEKNKRDWNSYSAKYLKYNHSDKILQPVLNNPSKAFDKKVWSQIQKNVGDFKGKKICVPSSGDNLAVFAFALLGAKVTSCDIANNQLIAAKEVAKRIGVIDLIEFVCTDTMTLDGVETGIYDFVYTSNGVHVWINDLNSMYQSIYRILKQNGIYIMFDIHPFQRPFGDDMKVIKPYDHTGPFEDEYSIHFHWRMQDILNAIISSGIQVKNIEEFEDEKDYDQPFWISGEDIVKGVTVSKEEVDRMYNWEYNPGIAIPTWLSIVGKK